MSPILSVIIPTFNRPDLLIRAVQSVLDQDFAKTEIIVIDDASAADVLSALRHRFSAEIQSEKLRYLRNETNKERSFSRNLGMEEAKGQYFAFLDDDDLWLSGHVRSVLDFFSASPELGMVITNYLDQTEDGRKTVVYKCIRSGKGGFYRELCVNRRIVSGSIYCVRKEVFSRVGGFREKLEPAEDREYLARIAMNYDVGYISEPSVLKFTHKGSFTSKTSALEHSLLKEKVWLAVEENSRKFAYPLKPSIKSDWYLHLAVNFLPDLEKTGSYLGKAIKVYPLCLFSLENLGLLLKVLMGRRAYEYLLRLKCSQVREAR